MAAFSPRALAAALAGLLTLGGCSAYDDGYGYGGVSLGYGSGYYDPWYYGRYGWYDGFYYPGSGYYVYDRYGKRHRWNDRHRRHWESRRDNQRDGRGEWRDRDHDRDGQSERRREWRSDRGEHSDFRQARKPRADDGGRNRQWDRQRGNVSRQERPALRSERRISGPDRKDSSGDRLR